MKPVTRLADLKAKNQGKTTWREPVINDGNSVSFMVQEPPGTKYERRMYPDSAAWFVGAGRGDPVRGGEGRRTFEVVNATKGSYVFVPERLLHSIEVMGNAPAIRYEVTSGPSSTPVFEKRPAAGAGGHRVRARDAGHRPQSAGRLQRGERRQALAVPRERLRAPEAERDQEGIHSGSHARQPRTRQLHLRLPSGMHFRPKRATAAIFTPIRPSRGL